MGLSVVRFFIGLCQQQVPQQDGSCCIVLPELQLFNEEVMTNFYILLQACDNRIYSQAYLYCSSNITPLKMFDTDDIDLIIARALSANIASEEKQQLMRWATASRKNREIFNVLEKIWKERSGDPINNKHGKLADNIWESAQSEKF